MKIDQLQAGHQFAPYKFVITDIESEAYKSATGDDANPQSFQSDATHPLHADAVMLSRLIDELGIIEDRIETIHAGQQMTIHKTISPGQTIIAITTLKSNTLRRGSIWANFETTYSDDQGNPIAESTSTIILMPEENNETSK